MRKNIDLTMNRDFRKKKGRSLEDVIGSFIGRSRYPWDKVKKQTMKESELFHTGTKEERKRKKRARTYKEEQFCDCCGLDLYKKPWNHPGERLCSLCAERFNAHLNQDNNLPWKNRT